MVFSLKSLKRDVNNLPIPQYFNDDKDEFEPIMGSEGGMQVASVQRKWRSDFIGTNPAPNADKWTVVQTGAGMTVDVSNNELRIQAGTTANSETIIESVPDFSVALRAMAGIRLSQRIANQEIHFEVVSVDDAGAVDNIDAGGWQLDGTSATQGKHRVKNGTFENASGALTISTTASSAILEVEAFADEMWFHSRPMDSPAGRSNSYVRHANVPDPNRRYKFRIRVRNLGTAPASATTVFIPFVVVLDYAELQAEITAGRGVASAGQGIFATVAGTITATQGNANNSSFTDTTTNLAANATFTGTARDASTTNSFNKFRVMISHIAGLRHGTLVVEQSTDSTTWRETNRIPIPSADAYAQFEFAVNLRYIRVRFINGPAAQTRMFLASTFVRQHGHFPSRSTLNFGHSVTPLAGNVVFAGDALDLGDGDNDFVTQRVLVHADQPGVLFLEQSRDGATWRVVETQAVGAGDTWVVEQALALRYCRARYVNGAVAQGAFDLNSSLIRG